MNKMPRSLVGWLLLGILAVGSGTKRSAAKKPAHFVPPSVLTTGAIPYPPSSTDAGMVTLSINLDETGHVASVGVLARYPFGVWTGDCGAAILDIFSGNTGRKTGGVESHGKYSVRSRLSWSGQHPSAAARAIATDHEERSGIHGPATEYGKFCAVPVECEDAGSGHLQCHAGQRTGMREYATLRDVPSLTASALSTLKKWTLAPATYDGNPIQSTMVVAFVFRISIGAATVSGFEAWLWLRKNPDRAGVLRVAWEEIDAEPWSCESVGGLAGERRRPAGAGKAGPAEFDVKEHYTKYEYRIAMRDGVRLFTAVYVPKDNSHAYPFLINRTPYSVAPYGVDQYRTQLGPSADFDKAGYIFVMQDVRGRYMSEGTFVEMRPHIDNKKSNKDVDDSSDLYDTIEWLLKNVPNNNGKAGIWGISYPGFYTSASMIDTHPALKAASPQAPMTDLFKGDDAYHGGAFMLAANYGFYSSFPAASESGIAAEGAGAF